MSLQLDWIAFNHDPGSANHDAINVRRNFGIAAVMPEWQRGMSESVAAYAARAIRGIVTVHARLTRLDPSVRAVEVRAVPVDSPQRTGLLLLLAPLWPSPLFYAELARIAPLLAQREPRSVLGSLRVRTVRFGPADSAVTVPFELEAHRLTSAGVGVSICRWRWQFRAGPGRLWTDFAVSRHRIFTLLDVPTAPWQQLPFTTSNTQLPWTEVLDVACTWAGGASTADDAAQRITRTVHDLGAHLVQYDCLAVTDGPGAPHYSLLLFQCTAFLQLLRGAPGNGHLVNCSDCATVVSTFANALGCDLWQSTMGFNFVLNPTRSIGFDVWLNGCGFGAFTMHEVAWSGATDAADPVWDACLELNGNFNPSVPPFVPLLAVNMRFGLPGQGLYRDRLAAPAGRFNCNPLPQTRQRRPVI